MNGEVNYLHLTIAVAFSVFLGSVLLWLVSIIAGLAIVSSVLSGLHFTANDPPASPVRDAVLQHQALERKRQVELQRRQSAQGKHLWAICREWTKNYRITPTDTLRMMRKYHCDRYHNFVVHGVVRPVQRPAFETR